MMMMMVMMMSSLSSSRRRLCLMVLTVMFVSMVAVTNGTTSTSVWDETKYDGEDMERPADVGETTKRHIQSGVNFIRTVHSEMKELQYNNPSVLQARALHRMVFAALVEMKEHLYQREQFELANGVQENLTDTGEQVKHMLQEIKHEPELLSIAEDVLFRQSHPNRMKLTPEQYWAYNNDPLFRKAVAGDQDPSFLQVESSVDVEAYAQQKFIGGMANVSPMLEMMLPKITKNVGVLMRYPSCAMEIFTSVYQKAHDAESCDLGQASGGRINFQVLQRIGLGGDFTLPGGSAGLGIGMDTPKHLCVYTMCLKGVIDNLSKFKGTGDCIIGSLKSLVGASGSNAREKMANAPVTCGMYFATHAEDENKGCRGGPKEGKAILTFPCKLKMCSAACCKRGGGGKGRGGESQEYNEDKRVENGPKGGNQHRRRGDDDDDDDDDRDDGESFLQQDQQQQPEEETYEQKRKRLIDADFETEYGQALVEEDEDYEEEKARLEKLAAKEVIPPGEDTYFYEMYRRITKGIDRVHGWHEQAAAGMMDREVPDHEVFMQEEAHAAGGAYLSAKDAARVVAGEKVTARLDMDRIMNHVRKIGGHVVRIMGRYLKALEKSVKKCERKLNFVFNFFLDTYGLAKVKVRDFHAICSVCLSFAALMPTPKEFVQIMHDIFDAVVDALIGVGMKMALGPLSMFMIETEAHVVHHHGTHYDGSVDSLLEEAYHRKVHPDDEPAPEGETVAERTKREAHRIRDVALIQVVAQIHAKLLSTLTGGTEAMFFQKIFAVLGKLKGLVTKGIKGVANLAKKLATPLFYAVAVVLNFVVKTVAKVFAKIIDFFPNGFKKDVCSILGVTVPKPMMDMVTMGIGADLNVPLPFKLPDIKLGMYTAWDMCSTVSSVLKLLTGNAASVVVMDKSFLEASAQVLVGVEDYAHKRSGADMSSSSSSSSSGNEADEMDLMEPATSALTLTQRLQRARSQKFRFIQRKQEPVRRESAFLQGRATARASARGPLNGFVKKFASGFQKAVRFLGGAAVKVGNFLGKIPILGGAVSMPFKVVGGLMTGNLGVTFAGPVMKVIMGFLRALLKDPIELFGRAMAIYKSARGTCEGLFGQVEDMKEMARSVKGAVDSARGKGGDGGGDKQQSQKKTSSGSRRRRGGSSGGRKKSSLLEIAETGRMSTTLELNRKRSSRSKKKSGGRGAKGKKDKARPETDSAAMDLALKITPMFPIVDMDGKDAFSVCTQAETLRQGMAAMQKYFAEKGNKAKQMMDKIKGTFGSFGKGLAKIAGGLFKLFFKFLKKLLGGIGKLALKGIKFVGKTVVKVAKKVWGGVKKVGKAIGKFFCFAPDTAINMADGTTRPLADIRLGDQVQGGTVTATMQFSAQDARLFDYQGVVVASHHKVLENGEFIAVAKSALAVPVTHPTKVLYDISTDSHRIHIGDITFADFTEVPTSERVEDLEVMALNSNRNNKVSTVEL